MVTPILVERVERLSDTRMHQICVALGEAVDCQLVTKIEDQNFRSSLYIAPATVESEVGAN